MVVTDRNRALQGTLGLSLAMGIGRFFYTPMLPLMIAALGWYSGQSAWIATANYLGYLLGCILMARGMIPLRAPYFRATLMASTLCLAAIALTPHLGWQLLIRFLSGVFSALIFVFITQALPRVVRQPTHIGLVYGGVGCGIVLSGLVVSILGSVLGWRELWLCAAVLSALLSLVVWTWPVEKGQADSPTSVAQPASVSGRPALLKVGYFFEGFGYIIIGTYLVVLAEPVFGATAAALTWIIVGLAAAPSPMLWSQVAQRWGRKAALRACYGLQILGAITAVFGSSTILLIVAALLFGSTFMGVVMLSIATGTQAGIPHASATLTTWYSVGQVLGPALVAVALGDSIATAFVVATVALVLGFLFTLASRL